MSQAWETTVDDISNVLNAHGVKLGDEKIEELHDELDHDEIETNVLRYNSMNAQTNSMLDDIENFLLEKKIVTGPKKFDPPTDDDEESEFEDDDEDAEEDRDRRRGLYGPEYKGEIF